MLLPEMKPHQPSLKITHNSEPHPPQKKKPKKEKEKKRSLEVTKYRQSMAFQFEKL
jgi:hypothetical protein